MPATDDVVRADDSVTPGRIFINDESWQCYAPLSLAAAINAAIEEAYDKGCNDVMVAACEWSDAADDEAKQARGMAQEAYDKGVKDGLDRAAEIAAGFGRHSGWFDCKVVADAIRAEKEKQND